MKIVPRRLAAAHVTERTNIPTTPQALADLARDGRGPPYSIMRGRAVYDLEALDVWINDLFMRGKRALGVQSSESREHA